MSKNKANVKGKGADRKKQNMTISIIVLAALFIVELYLMMNMPKEYLILGVIGLAMLIVVYRIIDLGFKIQDEKATKSEKEYENLFKSQRMSYLLMKENFEDMYVILKEIEDSTDIPIEDLIESQKAVAKVTIHRNKENANALMNSNEKMIEKMFEFEAKLNTMVKAMGSGTMAEEMPMMEEAVEMTAATEETEMPAMEEMGLDDVDLSAMESMLEEMPMMEEVTEEAEMPVAEEVAEEAVMPVAEEVTEEAEMPVAEEVAEEAVMPEAEEVTEEAEIPVTEEVTEDVAEEPAEMPVVEEKAEEPQVSVSDDPNHVMTPDEIAKLLGEAVETPAEEPVVEEKPIAPVSDDPNHVMTPDEIAALLGNL